MSGTRRHRVVIIGSVFGGLFGAKALKRADVDVTMISRTTHHLFQPLLYQVTTGILSQGEIAVTTREILKRQTNLRVLAGDVTTVDLRAPTVTSRALDTTTFGFSFGAAAFLAPLVGTQVLARAGEPALCGGSVLLCALTGVRLLQLSAAAERRLGPLTGIRTTRSSLAAE